MANLYISGNTMIPDTWWSTLKAFSANGLVGQKSRVWVVVYAGGNYNSFPTVSSGVEARTNSRVLAVHYNGNWVATRFKLNTASNSAYGDTASAGQKFLTNYSTAGSYRALSIATAPEYYTETTNKRWTERWTHNYTITRRTDCAQFIITTNSTAGWNSTAGVTNAFSSRYYMRSQGSSRIAANKAYWGNKDANNYTIYITTGQYAGTMQYTSGADRKTNNATTNNTAYYANYYDTNYYWKSSNAVSATANKSTTIAVVTASTAPASGGSNPISTTQHKISSASTKRWNRQITASQVLASKASAGVGIYRSSSHKVYNYTWATTTAAMTIQRTKTRRTTYQSTVTIY